MMVLVWLRRMKERGQEGVGLSERERERGQGDVGLCLVGG